MKTGRSVLVSDLRGGKSILAKKLKALQERLRAKRVSNSTSHLPKNYDNLPGVRGHFTWSRQRVMALRKAHGSA